MISSSSISTDKSIAGIGWRQPHYAALLEQKPALGFIEVHSENYFAAGGATRQLLRTARQHYEVSLHGVGLALGSAVGLDVWHLDKLADLVTDIEPVRVSDHLCFARAPYGPQSTPIHGSDLLPTAFTEESLAIFGRNIDRVQERLGRPILVENLSAYVEWSNNDYSEAEFMNALCLRSGCRLLVDVNNAVVNALNSHGSATAALSETCHWLDTIDRRHVAEVHLAGYLDDTDSSGWFIDDHGSRVHAPVWAAYEYALRCFGPIATCIEWDTEIPPFNELLLEAKQAASLALLQFPETQSQATLETVA